MEPPKAAQHYIIDLLTDPACAKDTIKGTRLALSIPTTRPPPPHLQKQYQTNIRSSSEGILHTIFWHRTFTPLTPLIRSILDTTLPAISDPDLEISIDAKATTAVRRLEAASSSPVSDTPPKLTVHISFSERRRKKTQGYFTFSLSKPADEEYTWETWAVVVSMQRARSEGEAGTLRKKMQESLEQAAFRVVELGGGEKDHIPPITSADGSPFPWKIAVGEVA